MRRDEAAAAARADSAQKSEARLREEMEVLRRRETDSAARIAEAEAKLKHADKTVEKLTEVRESMGAEFQNLSQKILEEKSKKFGEASEKILAPLKEDLEKFRNRADAMHTEDAKDRAALKQQIANLQNNAAEYGKSADNLARALKGDSKTQGDWGEIALATLLENSGLREGAEYETQKTMTNEDGAKLRPDVVVNLPGGKCLIIDSKVSLRDYSDSVAAEPNSDAEKAALKRHRDAVLKHVADLSGKHYAKLRDADAPDFVFMFMPVEPAFFAALRADANLFSHAYDKKIVLCAPTTLMATLRTVERIWQLERQNKNAEEIARQAGNMYDKIASVAESFDDIGAALKKAGDSFDRAEMQLRSGKGNLIGRANKLIDLGANPKKRLPEE